MLETIARSTQDGGVGIGSLIILLSAFIGLLKATLLDRGRRRERREAQERMLELQRQLAREEQRALRAEGTARVLKAALILGTALVVAFWLTPR